MLCAAPLERDASLAKWIRQGKAEVKIVVLARSNQDGRWHARPSSVSRVKSSPSRLVLGGRGVNLDGWTLGAKLVSKVVHQVHTHLFASSHLANRED